VGAKSPHNTKKSFLKNFQKRVDKFSKRVYYKTIANNTANRKAVGREDGMNWKVFFKDDATNKVTFQMYVSAKTAGEAILYAKDYSHDAGMEEKTSPRNGISVKPERMTTRGNLRRKRVWSLN
jgi:hypothetical protein